MSVEVREVIHGSPDYRATVDLRRRILRLPLGLDFAPEELAAENGQIHLAAYEDGDLIACGILVPNRPPDRQWAKVRQVAVEPYHEGKGHGRAIMRAAEEIAKRNGAEGITLHARTTAIPFYGRLAYLPEGPEFLEVSIPHRLMRKRLE